MAEDQNARFRARPGQEIPGESFGEAFKRHKAAGRPDFSWRGQTYSTETQEERTQKAYSDTSRRQEGAAAKASNRPGRVRPDETAVSSMDLRDIPGLIARGMSEGADRVPAGRGAGAAFTAAGAIRGAGSALGRALAGRMVERAASAPATTSRGALVRKTDDPPFKNADEVGDAAPASIPELGRGVWRSAREKAEAEARNAKPRVQVEGTKGGVYRGAKDEKAAEAKPEFRSRTADRMDEREMGFKKGGKVKAYAKGGSVKGSGCERRGLRPCKVY